MSIGNTSDLIETKKEIIRIESELKSLILLFSKKQKIDFERPNDYAERGFTMIINFDNFNIEAFLNSEKIIELWKRFALLRKKQKNLEIEFDSDIMLKKEMKSQMRSL